MFFAAVAVLKTKYRRESPSSRVHLGRPRRRRLRPAQLTICYGFKACVQKRLARILPSASATDDIDGSLPRRLMRKMMLTAKRRSELGHMSPNSRFSRHIAALSAEGSRWRLRDVTL